MKFVCSLLITCAAIALLWPATGAAQEAPRPPLDMFQWEQDGYHYRVRIRPGVATVGQAVEVVLDAARLLPIPDPRFGDRKPVQGANLEATIYLADGSPKAPAPLGRRLVAMRDRGAYGFHVTLEQSGIFGVAISGNSPEYEQAIAIRFPLPVDVWPVPAELKDKLPPPQTPAASFARADLTSGRNFCRQSCRTDIPWAQPAGEMPRHLRSPEALALTDEQLLETFISQDAIRALNELAKADLIHYLRSLHYQVDSLFPEAGRYTVKSYTIDQHGKNRLGESLKRPIAEELTTMHVLTLYQPAPKQSAASMPQLVPQIPRLLGSLRPKEKIGYLVFTAWPGQPDVAELAIAMNTQFSLQGIAARALTGAPLAKLERALRGFVGHGRFNDPRSLHKGPRQYRDSFLQVYLASTEAATMFVREENERFAFDAALGE